MTGTLATLWTERYREDAPPLVRDPALADNPVLCSLMAHRSVRAYRADPLPEGTLDIAIAAAQSAATSSNLQCWSVVAVEDSARRARLAQLSGDQAHVASAPLFLVWIADLSRLERIAERNGSEHAALDYTETFMVSVIDATLAAQNAVAALEALGLGTVYIGGLRNHPIAVARELALPARTFALFGLCVGYPDDGRPAAIKPRLPQQAVLHREHYDASAEAAVVAEYDVRADRFQREQGLPSRAWSEAMSQRIAQRESMHGRDTMRETLKEHGFPLL